MCGYLRRMREISSLPPDHLIWTVGAKAIPNSCTVGFIIDRGCGSKAESCGATDIIGTKDHRRARSNDVGI